MTLKDHWALFWAWWSTRPIYVYLFTIIGCGLVLVLLLAGCGSDNSTYNPLCPDGGWWHQTQSITVGKVQVPIYGCF